MYRAHAGGAPLDGQAQPRARLCVPGRHPGGPEAVARGAGGARAQVLHRGPRQGAGRPRQVPGGAGGQVRRQAAAAVAHPQDRRAAGGGGGHHAHPEEREGAAGARARAAGGHPQEAAPDRGPALQDGRAAHARRGGAPHPVRHPRLHLAAAHQEGERPRAHVHRHEAKAARPQEGPAGRGGQEPDAAQAHPAGAHARVRRGGGVAQAEGARAGGAGHARGHPGPHQRVVCGAPQRRDGRVPRLPRPRGRRLQAHPQPAAALRGRAAGRAGGGGQGQGRQGQGGRQGRQGQEGRGRGGGGGGEGGQRVHPRHRGRGAGVCGQVAGPRRERQLLPEVRRGAGQGRAAAHRV
mmetsp:Transcript_23253/g.59391  ORF Transcript_23253/g.59391 Transcript_23253/m.59391 type:complete len:350 (+) Transcript_23253:365-1414(+)